MADEEKENMIRTAEKLLKQGRIQQALSQYEKILAHSPEDAYVVNRIGDLYAKFGRMDKAKSYFRKIAIYYETMGFETQAMAIWKKIIKMDPFEAEASFRLAELLQNRKLNMEAKRYYLTAAESFLKNEDYENARKSYERLLALEPENIKLREKIGEVLITAGKEKEGAEEYLKMASSLEEQGLIEKAMKYYRKAILLNPARFEAAEEFLDRISLTQMKEQAIFFAEDLFSQMPEKGRAASMLANLLIRMKRYSDASKILDKAMTSNCDEKAYLMRSRGRLSLEEGHIDEALEWFDKAAQGLTEEGRYEDAREAFQEFVEKVPDHIKGLKRLLEINVKLNDKEKLSSCYQKLEEAYEKKGMLDDASLMREKLQEMSMKRASSPSRVLKREHRGPSVATLTASEPQVRDEESVGLLKKDEYIEKQITIADIYQKYELYDQVVHHLQEIIKKFPSDCAIREKLVDVLSRTGERELLAREAIELARIYDKDQKKDKAEAVLRKALKINPKETLLTEALSSLDMGKPIEPAPPGGLKEKDSQEEETFEIEIEEYDEEDKKYESLNEALNVLKERVEQEIASNDFKSHYDLGIAYKEMGLFDEAIQEFCSSRSSKDYFINATLMMGLCYRQKGDLVSAEKVIREGLGQAQSDEQKLELWYELADILFQKGDLRESYNLLNQILKINPDYRNTSIKAEKLSELLE